MALTATTITPRIRFAAWDWTTRFTSKATQYTVRRASQVESFPHSYPADMVERAQALLVRMAECEATGGDYAPLLADCQAFAADLDGLR